MANNAKIPFLDNLAQTSIGFSNFLSNLPPNAQITARFGIVTSVADPLNLGRVKVTYDNENYAFESDWIYCLNHPGGRISTEFIGQKCLLVFESGDPNKGVIVGFVPSPLDSTSAIGNPIKLPVIQNETMVEFGQVPECNQANLGSVIALVEYSGISPRICRRDDQENYVWQNLNTPQVVQTDIIENATPSQKIGDPTGAYIPGEIFTRKTCTVDQFTPYISDYSEDGNPRFRPLVSATVYNRATLPDCNTENLGAIAMIESDPGNTFPCICSKKDGNFRWLSVAEGREAIKFNEPFQSLQDTETFVRGKSQQCTRQSELRDTTLDSVQRTSDSQLSEVPEITDQLNLSPYIQTDAFESILDDLTSSRTADKGAKDRVNTLRTQLYTRAWDINDNNITQIEKIIDQKLAAFLGDMIPAMTELKDLLNIILRGLEIIARRISRGKRSRRIARRFLQTFINPVLRARIEPVYFSSVQSLQAELQRIRQDELRQTLQPGATLGNFDFHDVQNPLITKDYDLDRTVEQQDAEGTQVASKPYNSLKEGVENSNRAVFTLINSLLNFPTSLSAIRDVALQLISDTLPEEIVSVIQELSTVTASSLMEVVAEVIPIDEINAIFQGVMVLDVNSSSFVLVDSDTLVATLQQTLSETEIGSIISTLGSLTALTPRSIIQRFINNANALGLTELQISQITALRDFIGIGTSLSEAFLDINSSNIVSVLSAAGITIPYSDSVLAILGGDVDEVAQLAADIFFNPVIAKANYGTLVELYLQSDLDALAYIENVLQGVAGVSLDGVDRPALLASFRSKISSTVVE